MVIHLPRRRLIAKCLGMKTVERRAVLKTGLAVAGLTVVGAPAAVAAPKSELWERWLAHDANARKSVDHQAWDAFLAAYGRFSNDAIARVAYGAVSAGDRKTLAGFIRSLEGVRVSSLSRAEQYAL